MKGQVSMEVIIGAIILLLVLVFIWIYSIQTNEGIDALKNSVESKSYCREIADTISSVYASGTKTTIEFYSEKDFNLSNGMVDVNGFLCSYYAEAEEKFIAKGNIRIKDLNGVVVIENI